MSQLTLEDRLTALEQKVADLCAAHEADRKLLEQSAALQAERDAYLRSLYAGGQEQFTAEDFRDFPEEEGVDFVTFLEPFEAQRGAG